MARHQLWRASTSYTSRQNQDASRNSNTKRSPAGSTCGAGRDQDRTPQLAAQHPEPYTSHIKAGSVEGRQVCLVERPRRCSPGAFCCRQRRSPRTSPRRRSRYMLLMGGWPLPLAAAVVRKLAGNWNSTGPRWGRSRWQLACTARAGRTGWVQRCCCTIASQAQPARAGSQHGTLGPLFRGRSVSPPSPRSEPRSQQSFRQRSVACGGCTAAEPAWQGLQVARCAGVHVGGIKRQKIARKMCLT